MTAGCKSVADLVYNYLLPILYSVAYCKTRWTIYVDDLIRLITFALGATFGRIHLLNDSPIPAISPTREIDPANLPEGRLQFFHRRTFLANKAVPVLRTRMLE